MNVIGKFYCKDALVIQTALEIEILQKVSPQQACRLQIAMTKSLRDKYGITNMLSVNVINDGLAEVIMLDVEADNKTIVFAFIENDNVMPVGFAYDV